MKTWSRVFQTLCLQHLFRNELVLISAGSSSAAAIFRIEMITKILCTVCRILSRLLRRNMIPCRLTLTSSRLEFGWKNRSLQSNGLLLNVMKGLVNSLSTFYNFKKKVLTMFLVVSFIEFCATLHVKSKIRFSIRKILQKNVRKFEIQIVGQAVEQLQSHTTVVE